MFSKTIFILLQCFSLKLLTVTPHYQQSLNLENAIQKSIHLLSFYCTFEQQRNSKNRNSAHVSNFSIWCRLQETNTLYIGQMSTVLMRSTCRCITISHSACSSRWLTVLEACVWSWKESNHYICPDEKMTHLKMKKIQWIFQVLRICCYSWSQKFWKRLTKWSWNFTPFFFP